MKNLKSSIPNIITLLNLFMGCLGVYYAAENDLITAGICVVIGIFFDFFDGLAARLLQVSSELGKQLDSLADMVTSGLVPGYIVFQLINTSNNSSLNAIINQDIVWYAFIGFIVTLGSAYRLAVFNIDENQSDKFIGLPTPANTILICSIPFIIEYENVIWLNDILISTPFLIALAFVSPFLLNMKVELFSLKLKSFKFTENKVVFSFIIASVILLISLQFLAIPIIIISYVLVSAMTKIKKG